MLILIRWLCKKPVDLDLQCFEKRLNPSSAAQWLNFNGFDNSNKSLAGVLTLCSIGYFKIMTSFSIFRQH